MGRRTNETVYRVRWMRKKWAGPRSAIFLSRHSAERRLERLRTAWQGQDGPNPLLWTAIEHARVAWEGGEMDHRPYAYHPPVKKRKGKMSNLRGRGECRWCGVAIKETEPGIWKAGEYSVCPKAQNMAKCHEPL